MHTFALEHGATETHQENDGFCVLLQLEKELTYDNFAEWTRPDMMDLVEVNVGLPRFKLEEKYDMKTVLVSMGMEDAFDMAKSDFSGKICFQIIIIKR